MFTNKARLIVTGIFTLMLLFFIYQRTYQLAGIVAVFIGVLLWGYFTEGPIILAAKYYHAKDYDKAESLLRQISKPGWLSKKRRGFYEFMMGGICVKNNDLDRAEEHYELATKYPLRSVNDHVAALVHVANISIRQGKLDKAEAYLELAAQKEDKITAKMKEVMSRLRQELNKHQTKQGS
jgi:predicted Zn-dependent protease